MSRAWIRLLVSGIVGVITGGIIVAAWPPPSDGPPDPMRGVPPGGEATATVVEHFENDPIYVDPDLTHLLSDDDLASLRSSLEEYDLPTYVALVRSGHNDGWRNFLWPRIMRIADDVGVDGVYIAVDQEREVGVTYVHGGEVIDDGSAFLDEGSLGAAIEAVIATGHEDGDYEREVEYYETAFDVTPGAVIGGVVLGALAAVTAYGLLMLVVGIVRAIRGLPFRPPVTRATTAPAKTPITSARDRSRR